MLGKEENYHKESCMIDKHFRRYQDGWRDSHDGLWGAKT